YMGATRLCQQKNPLAFRDGSIYGRYVDRLQSPIVGPVCMSNNSCQESVSASPLSSIFFDTSCRSREQDMKAFLGEVPVVGQHLSEPLLAHHQHGGTIREAIVLIRPSQVEGQSLEKACAGLRKDRETRGVQQGLDIPGRPCAESWGRQTVIG